MSQASKKSVIFSMLEHHEIPRDGVLFVHSAFKYFARDGYGVEDTLECFVEYMDAGTLLFPTMSWRYVKPDAPYFDELSTPSNTGILTEMFRTKWAERRSIHPTHSVAGRGKLVDQLLDGHQLDDTPCSARSPFGRLSEVDAHVLMFGISMDCCTLIHHVEEMEAIDIYLRPKEQTETYQCTDRSGNSHEVRLRRHLLLPRDYWQFQDRLAARGQLSVMACDTSMTRHFKAQNMVDCVREGLQDSPTMVIAGPGQRYRMM